MCEVRRPAAPHSDWLPSRSDTSTRRISAIATAPHVAVPRLNINTAMIPNGCGLLRSRPLILRWPGEPAGEVARVHAPGGELGVGEQGAVQGQIRRDPVDGAAVKGV